METIVSMPKARRSVSARVVLMLIAACSFTLGANPGTPKQTNPSLTDAGRQRAAVGPASPPLRLGLQQNEDQQRRQQRQQQQQAPLLSDGDHTERKSSVTAPASVACNPISELQCLLNNRCLPIEWRCDFREQCPDGQDEWGCAPDWCDFGQGTCAWTVSHSSASAVREGTFWVRYLPNSSAWTLWRNGGQRQSIVAAQQMQAALHLLSTNEPHTGDPFGSQGANKFLFVPLVVGSTDGSEETESNNRQVASISAPKIGQTDSMCELRFEYAIWQRLDDGDAPLRMTTSLSLLAASNRSSDKPAQTLWRASSGELDADNRSPSGGNWLVGVVQLGHLKAVELSFVAETLLESRDEEVKIGSTPELNEAEAPAKLVHKSAKVDRQRHSTRSGQAFVALNWLRFHRCEWPQNHSGGPTAPALSPADYREKPAESQTGVSAKDDHRASRQVAGSGDQPDAGPKGTPSSAADFPGEKSNWEHSNEFQCSNGIRLTPERLCNFVNDCMTRDKSHLSASRGSSWNFTAAQNGAHCARQLEGYSEPDEDESFYLCEPIQGREDFERREGRLNLEFSAPSEGKFWTLAGNMLPASTRSGTDAGAVSITSNRPRSAHLPRVDHSLGSREGNFLSLDLGGGTGAERSDSDQVRWLSISSPWLKKLGETSEYECRLKFFYNLVSEGPPSFGATKPKVESPIAPFELQLVVEHFTLNQTTARAWATVSSGGGGGDGDSHAIRDDRNESTAKPSSRRRLEAKLLMRRKVDATIASSSNLGHSPDETRSGGGQTPEMQLIEYTGLDFWREANLVISSLKADDLFYVRLLIYVEYSRAGGERWPKSTMNIDDLSTHFGCALADDSQLDRLGIAKHPFEYNNFELHDYKRESLAAIKPNQGPSIPNKRNKWYRFDKYQVMPPSSDEPLGEDLPRRFERTDSGRNWRNPNGLEAEKLAGCVLAVFSFIIALIALIVFVLVPCVERAIITNRSQIELGPSVELADPPISASSWHQHQRQQQRRRNQLWPAKRRRPSSGCSDEGDSEEDEHNEGHSTASASVASSGLIISQQLRQEHNYNQDATTASQARQEWACLASGGGGSSSSNNNNNSCEQVLTRPTRLQSLSGPSPSSVSSFILSEVSIQNPPCSPATGPREVPRLVPVVSPSVGPSANEGAERGDEREHDENSCGQRRHRRLRFLSDRRAGDNPLMRRPLSLPRLNPASARLEPTWAILATGGPSSCRQRADEPLAWSLSHEPLDSYHERLDLECSCHETSTAQPQSR